MSGRVFHAPLLTNHAGFELQKIFRRSSKSSDNPIIPFPICRSYEEIIEDPEIELVVVNLPDTLHFRFTELALMAGKHVVVEKPFTVNSKEAGRLNQLAKQYKCVLSVFHNRRWDSDFLTIQKVLDHGRIGRPIEFEAHYDRFRPDLVPNTWKEHKEEGSGILYNLGSHLIDQAIQLFGMPDWVTADIGLVRQASAVPDYFTLLMRSGPVRIILKSSYLVADPGPKFILHGEGGSFIKHGADPQEEELSRGGSPLDAGFGVEPISMQGTLTRYRNGALKKECVESETGCYMAYYDQVYDAIRKQGTDYVTGAEGAGVVRVIEAAIESDRSGRRIPI